LDEYLSQLGSDLSQHVSHHGTFEPGMGFKKRYLRHFKTIYGIKNKYLRDNKQGINQTYS